MAKRAATKSPPTRTRRDAPARSRSKSTRHAAVRIEDLRRLVSVSAPRFSPDGRDVVFVRKHVCRRAETRTDIYVAPTDGSAEPRRLTTSGKDSLPRLSPDGSRLAFLSRRSGEQQVWTMPTDGGEPSALTRLPDGAIRAMKWSPDGSSLALSYRETAEGFRAADAKRRAETSESEPARVIDDLWYRLDGDGYFGPQRFKLLLVDADSGEHDTAYEADRLGMFDFDFSPDGATLAVTTNRHKKAMLEPRHTTIELVDVASGRVSQLPELPEGPKAAVCFSPDGSRLAYAGRIGDDGMYSPENAGLFIADAGTGAATPLLDKHDLCLMAISIGDTGDPDFAPWLRFSPDGKRLLFRVGLHGATHIASVTSTGRSLAFHTAGQAEHDPADVAGSRAGRLALVHSTPTCPPELAVLDLAAAPKHTLDEMLAQPRDGDTAPSDRSPGKGLTVLTSFNREYEADVARTAPTTSWITAEDGTRIHVRVLLPPGADAAAASPKSNGRARRSAGKGKKLPAVLLIHGGPHAQYGSGFFHEMHTLAAQGYAVVYPNPRGSKGYGRDFCSAIRGAWGAADWVDVQAVTAFMRDHPAIDAKRMAVAGGSYGGYMTNHVIGHTTEFAAAITDRCVSNLVSHLGNSDYYHKPGRYFPGNFWDDIDALWQQSPIRHMGKVKTPTLVIHSEGDLRCNVEQSEQVFAALQIRGVPSRMVRYPKSTFHGMSRNGPVDLREHRLRQIVDWLGRWM